MNKPLTIRERCAAGASILWLLVGPIAAACIAGCATKSRSFDAKGMYASESGQVAIGKVHVDAIPEGTDSAVVHYSEDTAWISDTKTHYIDVILTGTNSVGNASSIVDSICNAFVAVGKKTAESTVDAKEDAPDALDNGLSPTNTTATTRKEN